MDNNVLYKIGYGLYLLTARDENIDNGCIINTFMQVTSDPLIAVIAVNKQNYTHDMIQKMKEFNISVLTIKTPFEVFKQFGFQSGRACKKFDNYENVFRSKNGILCLSQYANAYISCTVNEQIDFGTHTLFKAQICDGKSISDDETVTYSYYQNHIKQKPDENIKSGYRCKICGYIYEGDPLPPDFICPICKHGAIDFIKI